MEILSQLFYFIIVITILVFVHEWGHFIAARLCGIRVDAFSIGMGKRLFGWNAINGFTFGDLAADIELNGNTDYRVSLLPTGGYVKVAGMVDESFDTEYANSEPKEWEFRSKNAFQKVFVLSNGVILNIIFAILVFAFLNYNNGSKDFATTTIGYIEENSVLYNSGLQINDKIVSIDNVQTHSWFELQNELALKNLNSSKKLNVIRNDSNITLNVSGPKIMKSLSENKGLGLYPNDMRIFVVAVETLSPAGKSGIQENDTLLSINGIELKSDSHLRKIVSSNKGTSLEFLIKRNDEVLSKNVIPNEKGIIGVIPSVHYFGKDLTIEYGIIESIKLGAENTYTIFNIIITSFKQIFAGNIKFNQAVGGPIMIAKQSSKSAEMGYEWFLKFLAGLSISLALINIFPFPALDGGHILMVIVEAIRGKEVPMKVKMAIQQFGVAILLLLIIYIFYIDIMR